MREQQFIRLVEEICYLLKLSQPCSKTALQYFLKFKEYQGHKFDQEILIAACVYLSTKIFQQEARLRDILNMIYALTASYKLARNEKQKQNSCQQQQQQQQVQQQQQLCHKEQQEKEYHHQICKQNQKSVNQIEDQFHQKGEQNNVEEDKQQQIAHYMKQHKQKIQSKNVQSIPAHKQQQQQHPHTHSHHNPQQHQSFIRLKFIQHHAQLHTIIQPHYTLSDYNQYKSKIIEAEQTLLRILGFDFMLAQNNKTQLKQLLITIHCLRFPQTLAETVMRVYNDLHYIDVQYSLEGVVYFAFLVIKSMIRQMQVQQISQDHNVLRSQKQLNQIKRLKEFVNKMDSPQQWGEVFNIEIKKLEIYAEKLANFYLAIQIK